MTEKLYDVDSHLKEFSAVVLDSYQKDGKFVTILDKTAFFPEAGGQPSDTGFIENARVLDVQIKDEVIYHETDRQFNSGDEVNCKIDWLRRFDFMQQHSGEHIISGVAHSLYGCENVGFHLSEEIVTLDFDIPLNGEQLQIIEQKANEVVFLDAEFKTYYPDKSTLQTLNYRSKKELVGDIRIVEIENTDMCACCAPHVKNAGQIGIIKLLSAEKLRGGVRIEIKCGSRALKDYRQKHISAQKLSSLFCVKTDEVVMAVERNIEEVKNLKYTLSGYKRSFIENKVSQMEFKNSISATFEPELEIKDLQYFADLLYKHHGGIRAVFSQKENGFNFCICGDSTLDDFFVEFKAKFAVRGGGRNGMVQGSTEASKEEIEQFFNT